MLDYLQGKCYGKKMASGIYIIKNTTNDKLYVGSSKDIKNRWQQHRRQLKNEEHYNSYLQNAWDKCGEDKFVFEVLEECEAEALILREQYYLDYYRSYERDVGYNVAIRADRSVFSEEAKEKMRLASTGRIQSPEERKKRSNSMKGKYTGEKSNSVKLSWEQVKEIRREYSETYITQDELAEKYKRPRTTIQSIVNNKSWKCEEWGRVLRQVKREGFKSSGARFKKIRERGGVKTPLKTKATL
jgi:group I intron endonuclease